MISVSSSVGCSIAGGGVVETVISVEVVVEMFGEDGVSTISVVEIFVSSSEEEDRSTSFVVVMTIGFYREDTSIVSSMAAKLGSDMMA